MVVVVACTTAECLYFVKLAESKEAQVKLLITHDVTDAFWISMRFHLSEIKRSMSVGASNALLQFRT